ncbi:MAG: hypothetical protein AAF664_10960 [Planctomycetota bacterium]
MNWRVVLAVIGLSIEGVSVWSQTPQRVFSNDSPPPVAERPESTRQPMTPEPAAPVLLRGSGGARFLLTGGRIVLDPPRHRKGSQVVKQPNLYESITIDSHAGMPSVHYVYRSQSRSLILTAMAPGSLRIESRLENEKDFVYLEQVPGCDVRMHHQSNNQTNECTGATLMHLCASNGVIVKKHFEALFSRMLRIDSFDEFSQTVLKRCREEANQIDRNEFATAALIDQLGSRKHAERHQATRELIALGLPAISDIERAIRTTRETETRSRLTMIKERITRQKVDTVGTLVARLTHDQGFMQIAMSDGGR